MLLNLIHVCTPHIFCCYRNSIKTKLLSLTRSVHYHTYMIREIQREGVRCISLLRKSEPHFAWREWRFWGKDSKWGSFVGQIRVTLNDMKAVRDCTHSFESIFDVTLTSPTNEPHLELRLWVIMLLLELSNCHPYFLLKGASLYS